MKRVVVALAAALAAAAAPCQPVRAPHHGDVLFHHFQGRWVAALGSLMVSQHFDRLSPHQGDAELLRGALLLDGGQHDEAGAVFERVADQHPAHRDRAWTMLAKARWQRGRVDDAEAALARIQAPLASEAADAERVLLTALVHLARGRAAEAATLLQPLASLPVARFNHAVALLRSGRETEARAALDALGRERAATEELRTMRDRANLALGQQALLAGDADRSRQALQRVRLHGADANAALLADGHAAQALRRPGDAVVAWSELAARPDGDDAVFEARLALPRAYADGGARGQALQLAEALLAQIAAQRQRLGEARAALLDGSALQPLLDGLKAHEPGDDTDRRPPSGPHADALRALWADHGFQTGLARWADLRWADQRLARWAQSLLAFEDMRRLRLQGFQHKLPATLDAAAGGVQALAALQHTHAALVQALAHAGSQDDGLALASPDEQRQLQLLQRMRADLAALGDDAQAPPLAGRLRRLDGLLAWQLVQQRPERQWRARKAVDELQRALARAQARADALEAARRQEPQRLAALGERLVQAARELAALQPRLLALADEQRVALQGQAVAALDRRTQALAGFELRARLLHVQLQDGTWMAQRNDGGGDATP